MNSLKKTDQARQDSQSTLEENLLFLRQLPFFSGTPLDTIRLYAYLARRESYTRNDRIVNQGDPCDRMFLIMSGKIAICENHHDNEFCLQTLTADGLNYFGELALLAQFDWFFSARALTDVRLLTITREAFLKVMEKYPERLPDAVSRIVQLRIQRFVDQTHFLLHNIRDEARQEYVFHPQAEDNTE